MATGSSTFRNLRIVGPSTLVRIPVATTTTRVMVVIPCIFSAIPTAMAVVTDLGKREIARKYFIPKSLAKTAVKSVLTTTARKLLRRILLAWCFIKWKLLYKGIPRTTVEGTIKLLR